MGHNWISHASLGITLLVSLFFGYRGQPTEMGLFIVAGGICMAFANLDKMQRFKGAGFEAEMKQVVDKA